MRYVWIGIMVVTGAPLLFLGWLINPLSVLINGADWWREWMTRLNPYRWQIVFLILVFGFSVGVYVDRYS